MAKILQNNFSEIVSVSHKKQLSKIKHWFASNYGIDCFDDNFLNNYLLRCNLDEILCKAMLAKYFHNKKFYPEYFRAGNLNEEGFRYFCSSVYSVYLPTLSSKGYRIFIDRVTHDENLFDISRIMKYYCMQTDLLYLEDGYDNGDVILFDCNHMKLFKLITFVPFFVKSLILLLEMYPLRIKLFILINTGITIEICIRLVKLILFKKFDNLIYAHADGHEFLHRYFSPNDLPTDYGGNLASLDKIRDEWLQRLSHRRDWFFKSNDTIEGSRNALWNKLNIFGTGGSFNRLQID